MEENNNIFVKNIIELPVNYVGDEPIFQTYNIKEYTPNCELKKFYAYVYDEYVYPYRGIYTEHSMMVGVYLRAGRQNETYSQVFINPSSEVTKKIYSISNIIYLSPPNISKLIDSDSVRDQDYDLLVSEGETFKPKIMERDNVLQRAIKKAICDKNIDFRLYASRFKNYSDYANHKRSIQQHRLAWEKFQLMCDVLDLDWDLSVRDKPNCPNPMGDDIIVSSLEED